MKHIAVIGATGLVGRQVVDLLSQKRGGVLPLKLFASSESQGEAVEYGGAEVSVEALGADGFKGVGVAILAAPPEVAKPIALRAQGEGVFVVDLSGGFRASPEVPLVAPGINEDVLDSDFKGRIVTLAQPATQAFLLALEPLRAAFGLVMADVTVLHGAATGGARSVERLARQTVELLNAKDPEPDESFPHRHAFNVVPEVGAIERGLSVAERALLLESARAWPQPPPALTCTALQIPTYHGLTLVISAHLGRPVDEVGVRELLKKESALKVLDEPEAHVYPMPMLTTDDPTVHVGRVRAQGPRVQLIAAVDNALRAADSAVEIALELLERE